MKENKDIRLKQLIEDNWNVPQLPQGSRERFIRRLNVAEQQKKRRSTWYIRFTVGIAASVMLFIFLQNRPEDRPQVTNTDLMIAEVRGYYKSLL